MTTEARLLAGKKVIAHYIVRDDGILVKLKRDPTFDDRFSRCLKNGIAHSNIDMLSKFNVHKNAPKGEILFNIMSELCWVYGFKLEWKDMA